jgi:hypothetical protein
MNKENEVRRKRGTETTTKIQGQVSDEQRKSEEKKRQKMRKEPKRKKYKKVLGGTNRLLSLIRHTPH